MPVYFTGNFFTRTWADFYPHRDLKWRFCARALASRSEQQRVFELCKMCYWK